MEKKFLKYSIEELLDDEQFVAWVLKRNKDYEWRKFISDNPETNSKIKKAREILLLLCDAYDVMDEESVLNIWQKIDQFDHLRKRKVPYLKIRKTLNWAASILLIISLGTLGYYKFGSQNSSYQFASSESPSQISEARIVLSNGEEISLKSNKSTIELNSDDKLVIDSHKVIDLSIKREGKNNEVEMNKVVIPFGKKSELVLADGTKVWLNAGSQLAFPSKFTNNNREVFLEGEACFEVTKNEKQPFIVSVDKMKVKVLGTHFNVSAYPGESKIETVLLEGSVALTTKNSLGLRNDAIILRPHQKATLQNNSKEIVVTDEPDAYIYVAWTEGWLQFSKESLHSVFTKLERYYNIRIHLPSNFPSSEQITGKLDLKDSLEDVLVALGDVARIEYRISDDRVYINKKVKRINVR